MNSPTALLREAIAQRNNQALKENIHSRSPFIISYSGGMCHWVLDGENIFITSYNTPWSSEARAALRDNGRK